MSRFRSLANLKPAHGLLEQAIGLGHTLMLSQMFEKGVREKDLDEAGPIGGSSNTPQP